MKTKLFLLFFLGCALVSNAQVGINTTSPNASSVLDLNSHLGGTNYGGFMPPRVTLAQRDLIPVSAAQDGLIVYTAYPGGLRCLQLYNGSTMAWENITCFGIPPVTGTVFFESMGNVTSNTNISAHYAASGFDEDDICTYTHTGSTQPQIRNVAPVSSSVFPSASGSGYLFLQASANRGFIIDGIDLTAHSGPLTLQILIYKSTTASNGSELSISYYDGTIWVDVSVSDLPTTAGSNTWHQRVLAVDVPNTIQSLRFTRASGSTVEFRIDDIEIINP